MENNVNDLAGYSGEPEFTYDMDMKTLERILKHWKIAYKDVISFLNEHPEIEKAMLQTPRNRYSEKYKRELIIRGTEELIVYLYHKGTKPKNLAIDKGDPFFETCKSLVLKNCRIWLPLLPRQHICA